MLARSQSTIAAVRQYEMNVNITLVTTSTLAGEGPRRLVGAASVERLIGGLSFGDKAVVLSGRDLGGGGPPSATASGRGRRRPTLAGPPFDLKKIHEKARAKYGIAVAKCKITAATGRPSAQPTSRPIRSNVDSPSRSKTNRVGRPTTRSAPRRKRVRCQAGSRSARIRAVTRQASPPSTSQTWPRGDVQGPLLAQVVCDGLGRPRRGLGGPADDLEMEPASAGPDAVDRVEQERQRAALALGDHRAEARRVADQARGRIEHRPTIDLAEPVVFQASIPELVRSTMMSAIPKARMQLERPVGIDQLVVIECPRLAEVSPASALGYLVETRKVLP